MSTWMNVEIDRQYHPVSMLFPLLEGAEFDELKADIAANGLLEAIWLHPDGSIIDGRNRHRACIETETQPRFRTWDNGGSLVSFVVSMNLHRRHLTYDQRVGMALKLEPAYAEEAKERQRGGQGGILLAPNSEQARSAEQAAQQVKVGKTAVYEMKAAAKDDPELPDKLIAGETTVREVRRERIRQERELLPVVPIPKGKFAVIYADPPWAYSNSGFDQSADAHYPTMSTQEICDLPVRSLAHDECVLFLWATSPLLPEAFQVITAWGFEYKASRVWVKDRAPGMGWFVRTRHEFLLIAVKGQGHPRQKLDSIIAGQVTEHSKKPESVYDDIEACYGRPYIELFARNERPGWESWGNEIDR